jgi:hypothetical protein
MQFDVLRDDLADARRLLARHRRVTADWRGDQVGRLSKTMMDSICIAARQLDGRPGTYRVVTKRESSRITERRLLDIAFDGPRGCSA